MKTDSAKLNLPLKMARANLDNLPRFPLTAGFAFRWFEPGDETHWRSVQLAAERFMEIPPELFWLQFGAGVKERELSSASASERGGGMNSALLHDRQAYLLAPGGEIIGTGTAWFGEVETSPSPERDSSRVAAGSQTVHQTNSEVARGLQCAAGGDPASSARWGRVHWMALRPEFQGRGLGQALMTAICRRLRALGHARAYLHTSSARIPAISLYLKFGFEPVFRNAAEEAVWKEVRAASSRVA